MMFDNLLMTLTNVVNGLYFADHEVYFTDHQNNFQRVSCSTKRKSQIAKIKNRTL